MSASILDTALKLALAGRARFAISRGVCVDNQSVVSARNFDQFATIESDSRPRANASS
jgi:hypothetical protein